MDLFTLRSMTDALRERRPPKRFFLDRFFRRIVEHETLEVDIDIVRNKRRLAPFVHPLSEGKLVEREGYSARSIRPAYIKPKMATTAADLLKRDAGEIVYSPKTRLQRAAERLAEDLATMDDMIIRREEWMAAQALMTGTVTVVGEGLNAVIDFGYSANHKATLTTTARWDNAAGVPLTNIRAWKSRVAQDSGLVPTDMVLGTAAAAALIKNPEFVAEREFIQTSTLVLRNDTSNLPQGVTYIGRVESLDVWVYEEWYLDDNGVEQPLVPTNYAMLGSSSADTRLHYGAIQDLKAGLAAMRRFPKSWEQEDPSARMVMVQSAPLPVPHQIDAFFLANVLG